MHLILLLFLLLSGTTHLPAAGQSLKKGIIWYEQRAEGADGYHAAAGPISLAIEYLEEALQNEDTEEKAAVYLLQSYYFKGTFTRLSDDEKRNVFAKGKALGETMLDKYPQSVAIRLWYVANTGRWAEAYGMWAAAKEGVADKLKTVCEEIIALDATFHNAAGYRVLGLVHFNTPYIPLFLRWPSNEKALEYLKKAYELAPHDPNNMFQYAVVLQHQGHTEKAKPLFEKVAGLTPRADFLVEDRKLRALAKEELE